MGSGRLSIHLSLHFNTTYPAHSAAPELIVDFLGHKVTANKHALLKHFLIAVKSTSVSFSRNVLRGNVWRNQTKSETNGKKCENSKLRKLRLLVVHM